MMRSKPASSMQKTYDECYLICSTAVYFESQENEAEALRSWRSALDQIYHHNANRIPSNYAPKSETEKALQESLRQLELQCKERVDLLETLKLSRKDDTVESAKATKQSTSQRKAEKPERGRTPPDMWEPEASSGWLGDGTVPPVQLPELAKPSVSLSSRPNLLSKKSNSDIEKERTRSLPQMSISPLANLPALPIPVPPKQASRSPSPDQKKTMLSTLRAKGRKSSRTLRTSKPVQPPAPLKAAGMAWDTQSRARSEQPVRRLSRTDSFDPTIHARLEATAARRSLDRAQISSSEQVKRHSAVRMPYSSDYIPHSNWRDTSNPGPNAPSILDQPLEKLSIEPGSKMPTSSPKSEMNSPVEPRPAKLPTFHVSPRSSVAAKRAKSPSRLPKPPEISYRKEFPGIKPAHPSAVSQSVSKAEQKSTASENIAPKTSVSRKPVANSSTPRATRSRRSQGGAETSSGSGDDTKSRKSGKSRNASPSKSSRPSTGRSDTARATTPTSTEAESAEEESGKSKWDIRVEKLMKNLPKGVDENAAKQIFNEIVVKGDEVHWDDVAGLDVAKKALKEAVVYPFLRPDLFMGLREPARGMLLFGPPGTGKTMLARAVATESKSTFFAISASSLTSKWHGESEKLVRALFALAKALAPSIIFVDEIDSLLSARSSSSEHEASRRSKTEFLIQWSDLQRAAAGKERTKEDGDPTRVLVLAATNVPWDIDEAARRRFVRRQYIPLPEAETRGVQMRTLLGHQKHGLSDEDIQVLTGLTDGFSGSDITALAKDAAMGPLRNLGEALLYTPMDQIPPISFKDFEASMVNIRPSVSKAGLKEYEDWSKEFGERGG